MLERYLRSRGAGQGAEDLAQELWIKAASLPPGTEVSEPSSYLFRMAHNLMLDRRRHELRRDTRDHEYLEVSSLGGMDVDPSPSAERALDAKRELDRVQAVLRSLGERTDYIFRRHRVEGIPQRDIAAELGISLSAVEKHLQRAYRAVQAAYREGGEHELA
jgi:RNA polymerase sigma-70 factor (ECF subfamily)